MNSTESTTARPSLAKKRAMSPVASTSVTPSHKKVKVEPATNETTKKPVKVTIKQDTVKKPAVPAKKMPVPSSSKSATVIESKPSTSLPTKDLKRLKTSESMSKWPGIVVIGHSLAPLSNKAQPSTKPIKSQSTSDIKQSTLANSVEKKSKGAPLAPLKLKVSLQPPTTVKPVPVKKALKVPVKTPPTSAPIVKSPVSIRFQGDPPPSSTNTNPSAIQTQTKKIPKKPPPPLPAPVIEKATRPSMPTAERVSYQSMRHSLSPSVLVSNCRNLCLHQQKLRPMPNETLLPQRRSPCRVSRSVEWTPHRRTAKVRRASMFLSISLHWTSRTFSIRPTCSEQSSGSQIRPSCFHVAEDLFVDTSSTEMQSQFVSTEALAAWSSFARFAVVLIRHSLSITPEHHHYRIVACRLDRQFTFHGSSAQRNLDRARSRSTVRWFRFRYCDSTSGSVLISDVF